MFWNTLGRSVWMRAAWRWRSRTGQQWVKRNRRQRLMFRLGQGRPLLQHPGSDTFEFYAKAFIQGFSFQVLHRSNPGDSESTCVLTLNPCAHKWLFLVNTIKTSTVQRYKIQPNSINVPNIKILSQISNPNAHTINTIIKINNTQVNISLHDVLKQALSGVDHSKKQKFGPEEVKKIAHVLTSLKINF